MILFVEEIRDSAACDAANPTVWMSAMGGKRTFRAIGSDADYALRADVRHRSNRDLPGPDYEALDLSEAEGDAMFMASEPRPH